MFDQIVSFSGGNVTYRSVIDNLNILDYDYYFNITESLLKEDNAKTLLLFDEILARGFDGSHFISGLSEHFRNLLVSKDQSTIKLLEVSEGIKAKYLQQSNSSTVSFLLSALNIANQCDLSYRLSKNQRLQVELALLKMCNLPSVFNLATSPMPRETAGDLKKKPDLIGLGPEKENKTAGELPVASDNPLVYNTGKHQAGGKQPDDGVKKEETGEKPKIFIPNLHIPSTSVKIPSLKDMGKITEELPEEDPYIKGTAKDDFTTEQFSKCWSDYAAKLKAEGKKNLLTIFTSNPPKLVSKNNYEIIVENKVQENYFRDERPDLHNFLRGTLRNFEIEIGIRVDEKAVVKRPYTTAEKFQHMATKNPALVELKNKFNLDFD